jgi:hypothetical protein
MSNTQKNKIVYLHIPKTGGAAMQYYFYDQVKHLRNYFLSFFGHDDSRFFEDERSTKGTNHCLIEAIHKNPKILEKFKSSVHFDECSLLFGHTTVAIESLFPEYNFQYLTVIRDPIERTISNIIQFTKPIKDSNNSSFARYTIDADKYSIEFWNQMYEILEKKLYLNNLLVHECCYLSNCMTRVLAGDEYLVNSANTNIDQARINIASKNIKIGYYHKFNISLQKCLDHYNIPINMSKNYKAKGGEPEPNKFKSQFGKYYGATEAVIDWVIKNNMDDITIYKELTNE